MLRGARQKQIYNTITRKHYISIGYIFNTLCIFVLVGQLAFEMLSSNSTLHFQTVQLLWQQYLFEAAQKRIPSFVQVQLILFILIVSLSLTLRRTFFLVAFSSISFPIFSLGCALASCTSWSSRVEASRKTSILPEGSLSLQYPYRHSRLQRSCFHPLLLMLNLNLNILKIGHIMINDNINSPAISLTLFPIWLVLPMYLSPTMAVL